MIARGLIGGYHEVVVVWGEELMECKEELKQQMSALQGELDDSKRLIGGYHRVIVVLGGG